jgi:uncharacterized protein YbaP (TraB family)
MNHVSSRAPLVRWRAAVAGLLSMLACALPCAAQPKADCPPAAEALTGERLEAGMRDARDHGFLWRITQGDHASYLYGTIHVTRYEWMFPGPSVREALDDSDTLALELDVLDPKVQQRLASAMAASAGIALPLSLQDRLRRRIEAECVAPVTLARLSPELQLATLTLLAARRDGLDPAYSVDLMLAGYARSAAKTVVSLESPESQLKALHATDRAGTLDLVQRALDDLDAGRTRPLMRRVASIWAAGDHAELARYDEWCECRRTPAEAQAMKRLLDDRNPLLAERIDALHRDGRRVFAAVGSLHMVGPGGLPALLRQRGYKVEAGEFAR